MTSIVIDDDLVPFLKQICAANGISMKGYVNGLLENAASAKTKRVWFVWGEDSTVRVNRENAISEYSFDTNAEMNAFLNGVDAVQGWLDYAKFDTLKEAARTFANNQEKEAMSLFQDWALDIMPPGDVYDELWYADGKYEVGEGGIYVVKSEVNVKRYEPEIHFQTSRGKYLSGVAITDGGDALVTNVEKGYRIVIKNAGHPDVIHKWKRSKA